MNPRMSPDSSMCPLPLAVNSTHRPLSRLIWFTLAPLLPHFEELGRLSLAGEHCLLSFPFLSSTTWQSGCCDDDDGTAVIIFAAFAVFFVFGGGAALTSQAPLGASETMLFLEPRPKTERNQTSRAL